MRAVSLLMLSNLSTGCMSFRAGGGYAPALSEGSPGSVELEGAVDVTLGPKTRNHWIDSKAPCHYGLGYTLHGRFGDGAAMVAPGLSVQGTCQALSSFGVVGRVGVDALSFGAEDGTASLGFLSPSVQLGPRFGKEGAFIDVVGLLGYEVRVAGVPSYPIGGVMMLLTLGLEP